MEVDGSIIIDEMDIVLLRAFIFIRRFQQPTRLHLFIDKNTWVHSCFSQSRTCYPPPPLRPFQPWNSWLLRRKLCIEILRLPFRGRMMNIVSRMSATFCRSKPSDTTWSSQASVLDSTPSISAADRLSNRTTPKTNLRSSVCEDSLLYALRLLQRFRL